MQHRIELSTVLLIAVRSTEGMEPVKKFKQQANNTGIKKQIISPVEKSKKICIDVQGNMVAIAGKELTTV